MDSTHAHYYWLLCAVVWVWSRSAASGARDGQELRHSGAKCSTSLLCAAFDRSRTPLVEVQLQRKVLQILALAGVICSHLQSNIVSTAHIISLSSMLDWWLMNLSSCNEIWTWKRLYFVMSRPKMENRQSAGLKSD